MKSNNKETIYLDSQLFFLLLLGPLITLSLYFIQGSDSVFWFKENINLYLKLTFLAAIAEELLFRGILFTLLKPVYFFKRKIGILSYLNISVSIIFSLLHLFTHSPLWAILTFFPSLIFGYSLERYKKLLIPIIIHLIYNLCYFLIFR